MIPDNWFGQIDVVVAGILGLVVVLVLVLSIPDIARYFKLKSM